MGAFPRLPRQAFALGRVTVFGAFLVAFALPHALAKPPRFGGGFNRASGSAFRPAPVPQHSNPTPQRPAPQRPAPQNRAHQKYVPPPKQTAKSSAKQKSEFAKHSAINPPSGHGRGYQSSGRSNAGNGVGKSQSSPGSTTTRDSASNSERYSSPWKSAGESGMEKSFGNLRLVPSQYVSRYFFGPYRHYAYWDHPWYDAGYYYDGYWYADSPYYDYYGVQRQMAIASIAGQIAAAQEVLDSAVSSQESLEKDRQAATERIKNARDTIQSALDQQTSSTKTMRDIEDRLTKQQGPNSELRQAQAKVDASRAEIDAQAHRVLGLPAHAGTPTAAEYAHEIAMLTPAQKEQLDQDVRFREAMEKLKAAAHDVAQVQKALFEKDPEWVEARDAALKAKQEQTAADRQLGKDTGVAQLGKKVDMEAAQDLAAQAREVIAAGRAALRSLGATPPAIETASQASPSSAS